MYKITIITIGKQRFGPHQKLFDDYLKRLRLYAKIDIKELTEKKFRNTSDKSKVLEEEAKRIETALPENSYVIALDAGGRQFGSEEFAMRLDQWSENGTREIAFIIGGPLGLHDIIKTEADLLFSFSNMTFPHDLARVMLGEQLYRAMTILTKKTYHY